MARVTLSCIVHVPYNLTANVDDGVRYETAKLEECVVDIWTVDPFGKQSSLKVPDDYKAGLVAELEKAFVKAYSLENEDRQAG